MITVSMSDVTAIALQGMRGERNRNRGNRQKWSVYTMQTPYDS